MWFHDNLVCLGVFILIRHCCLALGDSFLAASSTRGVWGYLSRCRRWSTPSRAPTSSSKEKVGCVISLQACMSCRSPSGFLGGVLQVERRRFFIWKISYFRGRTSRSFLRGLLGSVVSNETLPSTGCSLEDVFSEFGGEAGRSDRMERLDYLYFIAKRSKHRTVMEFLYYSY